MIFLTSTYSIVPDCIHNVSWCPLLRSYPNRICSFWIRNLSRFKSVLTYWSIRTHQHVSRHLPWLRIVRCGQLCSRVPTFRPSEVYNIILRAEGATVLLAGISTLMTPLPYVVLLACIRTANEFLSFTFSKMGARLRANARFAAWRTHPAYVDLKLLNCSDISILHNYTNQAPFQVGTCRRLAQDSKTIKII